MNVSVQEPRQTRPVLVAHREALFLQLLQPGFRGPAEMNSGKADVMDHAGLLLIRGESQTEGMCRNRWARETREKYSPMHSALLTQVSFRIARDLGAIRKV
jgi:hypothetical protein